MGLREIKILDNIPFYVLEEDKGLSQNLIRWGNREKAATDFFQTFINKDDIVLDIGSNIGYYAVQEARLGKKVYAIEPMIQSFEILNKNIELNKFDNVESFNYAIGDKNEDCEIYHCGHLNLSKMIPVEGWDKTKIKMLTGKTFLEKYLKDKKQPNVLRMDVEGYELNILKGFENSFKCFDKCFIEVHHFHLNDSGTKKLLEHLQKFGFNKAYVISTDKERHGMPNIEPVIKEGWCYIEDYKQRFDFYHVTYLFVVKELN